MTASAPVAQHAALVVIGGIGAFGAVAATGSTSPVRAALGAPLAAVSAAAVAVLAGATPVGVALMLTAVAAALVGVVGAAPMPEHHLERPGRQDVIAAGSGVVLLGAVLWTGIDGLAGRRLPSTGSGSAARWTHLLVTDVALPYELAGLVVLALVVGLVAAARRTLDDAGPGLG